MRVFATVALAALLVGCGGPASRAQSDYRPTSPAEAAMREIKAEWLQRCQVGTGNEPDNEIGNLLDDYSVVGEELARCGANHNSLVDFLLPYVNMERSK